MAERPIFYKGVKYDYRVQARWAVFFDTLGVDAAYKPEGFDGGRGVFFEPDFFIPDWNLYLEARDGPPRKDERDMCRRLSEVSGFDVLMVFLEDGEFRGMFFHEGVCEEDQLCLILDCRVCEAPVLFFETTAPDGTTHQDWEKLAETICDNPACKTKTPSLRRNAGVGAALAAAAQTRF